MQKVGGVALRIDVYLKGNLSYYQVEKLEHVVMEVEMPITLKEILDKLGIPASEVEGAFLDGQWVPVFEPLEKGGRLDLVPIIGGG